MAGVSWTVGQHTGRRQVTHKRGVCHDLTGISLWWCFPHRVPLFLFFCKETIMDAPLLLLRFVLFPGRGDGTDGIKARLPRAEKRAGRLRAMAWQETKRETHTCSIHSHHRVWWWR